MKCDKKIATIFIFALISTLLAINGSALAQQKLEKVNVTLDFTVGGSHAPWFVAKEKGFFSDLGLDVNIMRGYGSGDTIKKLTAGATDIGFNHPAPLVIAASQGEKIKMVMSFYANEMCASYSAAEGANIRKPKDLEGKTFGGPAGDACLIILPALAQITGVDMNKIQINNMDAPSRLPMLAAGKIDFTFSFYEKDILFKKAIEKAGKNMVSFRFSDYLSMYSNGTTVHQRTMDQRPEMVTKFIAGLYKGLKYTILRPNESLEALMKANPEMDRDYAKSSLESIFTVVWDDTTLEKGLGMIDKQKMTATRDIIAKYFKIAQPPPVEDLYTNEYLEKARKTAGPGSKG